MTCQTDDEAREKAYLHIVEVVDPWLKPRQFALMKKLAQSPLFPQLPPFYNVYRRSVEAQVKIYREENIARETAVAKLTQQYQKVSGGMTVQFDGEEQTLTRMSRIQEEPDRARRETAWKTVVERRLQDSSISSRSFSTSFSPCGTRSPTPRAFPISAPTCSPGKSASITRRKIAFASMPPLSTMSCHSSANCRRNAAASSVVEKLRRHRRHSGTASRSIPDHHPALRPFTASSELVEKSHQIFSKLDPRLGDYYTVLRTHELVDLDNRKGKAPGGYQSTLSEARVPFIFMNAVGVHRDVETLLHEAGHAFHALAAREQPLHAYRGAPIEFCEVASMGMELLAAPHLHLFYSDEDAKRARRDHLENIIKFFPWMATIDAFQHWLYTHPGHSREERAATWLSLRERFGGNEDWSGFEKFRRYMWHRQLHVFEIPFYYVEYGIAQLGALQLWQASRRDLPAALNNYLKGLSLGGSRPLPELFEATGLAFDFTDKTIAPLMRNVKEALAELAVEAKA